MSQREGLQPQQDPSSGHHQLTGAAQRGDDPAAPQGSDLQSQGNEEPAGERQGLG